MKQLTERDRQNAYQSFTRFGCILSDGYFQLHTC